MISEEAVEAAARSWHEKSSASFGMSGAVFDPSPESLDSIRAALSAALPLLLEGKREEIARMIEPDVFWTVAECASGDYRESILMTEEYRQRALAKADRIIAMLGGGDVG